MYVSETDDVGSFLVYLAWDGWDTVPVLILSRACRLRTGVLDCLGFEMGHKIFRNQSINQSLLPDSETVSVTDLKCITEVR